MHQYARIDESKHKNKLNQQGYALGHFGDSSFHIDLVSIHPSPGKKFDR